MTLKHMEGIENTSKKASGWAEAVGQAAKPEVVLRSWYLEQQKHERTWLQYIMYNENDNLCTTHADHCVQ